MFHIAFLFSPLPCLTFKVKETYLQQKQINFYNSALLVNATAFVINAARPAVITRERKEETDQYYYYEIMTLLILFANKGCVKFGMQILKFNEVQSIA